MAIATARAFLRSEVAGSFASLGMALNAMLTALLVPPIVRVLGFTENRIGARSRRFEMKAHHLISECSKRVSLRAFSSNE